jgi:hypothetical protein
MIESEAMNRKCPFAWVEDMRDFLYCQTSRCMAWEGVEGFCMMLSDGGCQCHKEGVESGALSQVQ